MINFFSSISSLVTAVSIVSFICLFVFFIIFLVRFAKNGKDSIGLFTKLCGILVISITLISFGIIQYMEYLLFEKAESILAKPTFEVYVNGNLLKHQHNFAKDFIKRTTRKKSGSGPGQVFEVLILDGTDELEFEFKRDSRDKNMYWIYYPKYRFFANLGFIKTKLI